jgi:hypothetical protein
MKMIVGLLLLALSLASVASTTDVKTFTYDGTQNSIELLLRAEKTHTEYRYEQRQTTCFRTEIVGYRTICHGGGYGGPRPHPGPRPTNCWREPIYRQVAFPCTQTVQVPYEVKDFDVDARVLVDVTKMTEVTTPGEKFVVTLRGDELSLSTVGSKKFFNVLKKQDVRARVNGSVKFIDGLYAIELIEAAPVLKALKMTNIYMEKSVLSFNLGPIENRTNIGFSLNVVKKKTLASDETLFDRELDSSEIILNANTVGSDADVNVEKLGVTLRDGKYSLTAKAFFKAAGSLLNRSQFGEDLETSKTLIYKIR